MTMICTNYDDMASRLMTFQNDKDESAKCSTRNSLLYIFHELFIDLEPMTFVRIGKTFDRQGYP